MPRLILRLAADEYVEWSTVVDAPVSAVLSRKDAIGEFGADKVAIADEHVVSLWPHFQPADAEAFIAANRAGPNEERLSLEEIRQAYRA